MDAKREHEKTCNHHNSSTSISLNEILALTQTKDISREIKYATLHVVKQKMAKSNSKTVEFKSGGPRVSKLFHYKQ